MKILTILTALFLFAGISSASFANEEVGEDIVQQEESVELDNFDNHYRPFLGCVKRQNGCDILARRYGCYYGTVRFTPRCPNGNDNGRLTCTGHYCP